MLLPHTAEKKAGLEHLKVLDYTARIWAGGQAIGSDSSGEPRDSTSGLPTVSDIFTVASTADHFLHSLQKA